MDKTKKKSKVDGNNINVKTIEEKANKNFFNKRNIILIILTSLISLGLVFVTVMFIMDMNWSTFFTNIGSGLTHELGWLWLTLLIAFVIISFVYNYFPVWIRLRELGIKIKAWQYFVFALSISFLKGVTPANFVTDPYTIFWLKTQGVSTSRATSIIFSNGLLWQSAALLIHLPSFIVIMTKADILLSTLNPAGAIALIVFMSIGIFIDAVGVLVMVLLCFSKKAHFVLSSIFNWFKKKLHMKYHTKAEIEEKYKTRATIKNEVISYYRHWGDTVVVVLVLALYELMIYFSISPSLMLVNNGDYQFDVIAAYHSLTMAFNANRLNLIPGLGVGLEASLLWLLKVLGGIQGGDSDSQKEFLSQGIFVWRSFFTYFTAVIGLFGFGTLTVYHVSSYKHKKGAFIESKYE